MAETMPSRTIQIVDRVFVNSTPAPQMCYTATLLPLDGIWLGDNPLHYSLTLFIVQMVMVVLTTRALFIFLKPLRQPRVVAEIIGGMVLGPSVLGSIPKFSDTFFPSNSLLVLHTIAHLGLLYFVFMVGVEMDILLIKRMGRKAVVIATVGMLIPFVISTSTSFLLRHKLSTTIPHLSMFLFLGVALSVTAFPVLARILAELKLLNSDIGRLALSSAIINDVFAWILLALAIAISENKGTLFVSLWVLLCAVAFVLACFFVVRPAIWWVINHTPDGEPVSEVYLCIILTGVMVSGLITDVIGIHSVFGAFVFGMALPSGPLGDGLINKLEHFVSELLLPLYFAISGLRTNVRAITQASHAGFLVLLITVSGIAKVAGILLVALYYAMPFRDGLSLGLLMNTKGLIEMIVLNIGRDSAVLDDEAFALMVLMSVAMTSLVTPVVTTVFKPGRQLILYKRRSIQRLKPDSELRMLACVHTSRNVPTIASLLEISHPTKRSSIFLYALNLFELTGRATAMFIVHSARRTPSHQPPRNIERTQTESELIVTAFESFAQHTCGVTVQTLTAISPYSTMHEDVCSIAEDKRVALIVLPFHKQQTVDGDMEATNPEIRMVNQNVLANAPCSVGILVDRGIGETERITEGEPTAYHIALLFFGGPDDREALAYALRMSKSPGTNLTVLRFRPGPGVASAAEPPGGSPESVPGDGRTITVESDSEGEYQLDEEWISEFRFKTLSNERLVYVEEVVNNGEETVAAIRSMDAVHKLYIVGRGEGVVSPLTAGLTDWSECPELGPIGDLLASSDFAAAVSVLVVQQYVGGSQGTFRRVGKKAQSCWDVAS